MERVVDFFYEKSKIEAHSGCMFKGRHYRCFYVTFPTLYKTPAPGTETVQLYDFRPKDKIRASVVILHGLGTRNIEFLLWMGTHLASAGVNAVVPILPGNFTRIEDGMIYGSRYLWPDINVMYDVYQHAIVDIRSTIDYLEQQNRWKDNNCMVGYCLGGMLTTIVSCLDERINQKILMTTGGNIPQLLFESSSTRFVRRLIAEGRVEDRTLNDKNILYEIYDKQFPQIKQMSLEEIITSRDIHPLFKVDPLSYAHLLDKSKVSVIDALFDRTLSITSRKSLFKEMEGAKRYVLPISHVNWLPFEFLLGRYILHKVNIYDRKTASRILTKEIVRDAIEDEQEIWMKK
ncbi:MAG TPA: alpha/beta hydrolase [Clostridiales bacterium]|nr:alpha/beta hydrolase [Clostridiales bacterium]